MIILCGILSFSCAQIEQFVSSSAPVFAYDVKYITTIKLVRCSEAE